MGNSCKTMEENRKPRQKEGFKLLRKPAPQSLKWPAEASAVRIWLIGQFNLESIKGKVLKGPTLKNV